MKQQAPTGRRAGTRLLFEHIFAQRALLVCIVLMSVVGSGIALSQPWLIGKVIERVSRQEDLNSLPWLLAALVVAGGVLGGFLQYLIQRAAEGAIRSSRYRLIDRLLRLPIPQLDKRRVGDMVSRVSNDTTLIRNMMSQGFTESIAGVFTLVGAIVAMVLIDPLLLIVAFAVSLVAVICVVAATTRIEQASLGLQTAVGNLSASVDRALRAIRTVRSANGTATEAARVKKDVDHAWLVGLRVARITAVISPISSVAMQATFLTVLGLGGLRVASGVITVAQLVSFILFLFLMIMPLGQLFGTMSAIGEALGGASRINEILSMETEEGDFDANSSSSEPAFEDTLIEFENVWFAYQPSEDAYEDSGPVADTTLSGLSFQIRPGQRVALVGPSGGGKTTILSLIERFYDPDRGVIRFGGRDVTTVPRASVRSHVAYVEQGSPALAGSLRDNLKVGAADASDDDLLEALREVNLIDLVDRSPHGLDSDIGEGGVLLSGGERQRIAVARALLSNPSVLLLDESTSNLDGMNEIRVRDYIDEVALGCTLVVVAHRLATVIQSDLILVVDNGRLVASGTHQELLASSPLYSDLAREQLISA